MKLTIQDVTIISRTRTSKKVRTKRDAYALLKLTDTRLKAAAEGKLELEEGVRIHVENVVAMLWDVRAVAKAQWEQARAAAPAAAAVA